MAKAELFYLDGRGLGEIVRYMLYAAGVEFNDNYMTTQQDLENLRATGDLIFGQTPLLRIEGRAITQRDAIIRFLARNYNLYGTSEDDRIMIDKLNDGIKDAGLGELGIGYIFRDEESKQKTVEDMQTKAAKYLPKFEKILVDNNGVEGFLVGDQLSFVDVVLVHDLEWFLDVVGRTALEKYSAIEKYFNFIRSQPNIAKFLSSPQKKPFPDEKYRRVVRAVFYGE